MRASVKNNHASGPASFLDRPKRVAHARFMPLAQYTLSELRRLVGSQNVLTEKEDLIPYSFDGTAAMKQMPGCVALATTTEQIVAILKLANQTKTPVVTRGSGTGLSGGSLPVTDTSGPTSPLRGSFRASPCPRSSPSIAWTALLNQRGDRLGRQTPLSAEHRWIRV